MDDKRAALMLACLALAGAGVRYFLSPSPASPPGDVQLQSSSASRPNALRETARRAAQLSRPLLPGEKIDLDNADVSEITRLPRVGPALAQRIVAWRTQHGQFGTDAGHAVEPRETAKWAVLGAPRDDALRERRTD